jgi:hypothetical protein
MACPALTQGRGAGAFFVWRAVRHRVDAKTPPASFCESAEPVPRPIARLLVLPPVSVTLFS